MTNRMRADRLLVERGLFESRAKAQAAIAAGLVTADHAPVAKPADEIPADAVLRAAPAHPYVSRGGVKLAAALDHFRFDPKGRVGLDVGASTGGFSEVLLARGPPVATVIDVGFASLTLVVPAALALARRPAALVALVKPQFEAGRRAA